MTSLIVETPRAALPIRARPSRLFAATAFVLVIAAQLLVYSGSYHIKPAGDDFPIVNEINRGNIQGIKVFFTQSVIRIGYRPLKSLTIWWFGNLSDTHRFQWIRVLHLLAAILYAAVGLAWIRSLPLGKLGTIVSLVVLTLHPILPAAIGSLDGIDSLAGSAFLWFGAWCAYQLRQRVLVVLPVVVICFIIGLGFKEVLFALVPLAPLTIFMFWKRHPLRDALIVLVVLLAISGGVFVLRQYVIAPGESGGFALLTVKPYQYCENIGLFITALLFFGNSIWLYDIGHSRWSVVYGMVAFDAIVTALLGYGIWRHIRRPTLRAIADDDSLPFPLRKYVIFLVLGALVAFFPAVAIYHVAEMYVTPIVLPAALLIGLSLDGWTNSKPLARAAVFGLAIVAMVASVHTIRVKIDGLTLVGEQAEFQLKQLMEWIPPGTHDRKILALFLRDYDNRFYTYSVYRMSDAVLLVHEVVLDYVRPGDRLRLVCVDVDKFTDVDTSGYDMAFGWDRKRGRFFPIKWNPSIP
ncbi:MAG: hypothetical protein ACREJC_21180 [Tepidisphaeraceae bacterium]